MIYGYIRVSTDKQDCANQKGGNLRSPTWGCVLINT